MKTPEERESASAKIILQGTILFVLALLFYLIYEIIW